MSLTAGVVSSLLRGPIRILSPGGDRGRLSILIYHRVLPTPDPLLPDEPDVEVFRWQMQVVARMFRVIPLLEAVHRLADCTLPPRAACITFDDGYADNHDLALPILQSLGLPATFFVSTGFLDGGMMFNDRIIETIRRLSSGPQDLGCLGLGGLEVPVEARARHALAMEAIRAVKHLPGEERARRVGALEALSPGSLPRDLMMTTAQVQALAAAGMDVGGHTRNHPILTSLEDRAAREEIAGGKVDLEAILGRDVMLFAYPNGRPGADYDARHVDMVRDCGFRAAFSTAHGVSVRCIDPFQLPRFTPWDRTPSRFSTRLLLNMYGKDRG